MLALWHYVHKIHATLKFLLLDLAQPQWSMVQWFFKRHSCLFFAGTGPKRRCRQWWRILGFTPESLGMRGRGQRRSARSTDTCVKSAGRGSDPSQARRAARRPRRDELGSHPQRFVRPRICTTWPPCIFRINHPSGSCPWYCVGGIKARFLAAMKNFPKVSVKSLGYLF